MKYHHQDLANRRWQKLSLMEQLANIGVEVERTIKWRSKDEKSSQMAFFRALELVDLTIADLQSKKQWAKLKEICRLREVLVDYFFGENIYGSTNELWHKYFYPFNWAVRIEN
ncbi:hypothetical protein ACFL0Y_01935 [Patescibacteria group bacterium]